MPDLIRLLLGRSVYGFTPEDETAITRLAVLVGIAIGLGIGGLL